VGKGNCIKVDDSLKHIGFIMDGNGRWAKKRGMPREYGHRVGAETFRNIASYCRDKGIKAATFYAFSTENWKRPQHEVDCIMALFKDFMLKEMASIAKNDVKLVFLGSREIFRSDIRELMDRMENESKNNSSILNIAINYGGRDEIVYAAKKLAAQGEEITEDGISREIYTAGSPPLDLIVRTGGEIRLSNFMLWESAYAEFYFTDVLWPDFSESDVDKAVESFLGRKRRFGGVK